MTHQVTLETRSQFKGKYPSIPLDESFLRGIQEDDPEPFFVTLPIAHANTTSRNGWFYSYEIVNQIVDQINTTKPIARMGHLREEARSTDYDTAPARWMGAVMDSDGTAWGKLYVLQTEPKLREEIKVAMRANAEIGTSIYAMASSDPNNRITEIELESIDFAHPKRLGNLRAAAIPEITRETLDEGHPTMADTIASVAPVPTPVPTTVVTESEQVARIRHECDQRILELTEKLNEQTRIVADANTIRQKLGLPINESLVLGVTNLQQKVAHLGAENRDLLDATIQQMVQHTIKQEQFHEMICDMVKDLKPETRYQVQEAFATVMERGSVKTALKQTAEMSLGTTVDVSVTAQKAPTGNVLEKYFQPQSMSGEGV